MDVKINWIVVKFSFIVPYIFLWILVDKMIVIMRLNSYYISYHLQFQYYYVFFIERIIITTEKISMNI